ncbi:MAG: PAS domain S-box protein [Deltaproteobacteria bacterium]|jgi:PAS domain S-box-containing protein|nr:PAS domain S-box protein [Deltaproteobacteria bacterium]MDL1987209.1 PAS domain S-box protein [Deltaproteobacteria bacterium]
MSNSRILIVEDEGIIAKDIQSTLNRSGYSVIGIASSGEEAIKKAMEIHPDLVLMDIVLEGAMDGVEAAEHIRDHFDIPVVYLTAYSDDTTLQRAKITEPFGYILKPFQEKELYTTIEMALYKHTMQRKLKESEQWLATTLKSIGDAVIATDTGKLITFMNPVAEALTGWKQEEAIGKPLKDVFKIINEKTGKQADDPVAKVLMEGVIVGLANHTVLIAKDGTKKPVDDSSAPIRDDKGKIIGVVLVFRDISERKIAVEQLRASEERHRSVVDNINVGIALISRNMEILALNNQMKKWYPDIDISQKPICYKSFNKPSINDLCPDCPACLTMDDGEAHESIRDILADNEARNYRVLSSPLKDKAGKIIAAIEMVEDITDQKKAQEALQRSELKYRELVQNANSIILRMDSQGNVTFFNEFAQQFFGYTEDEILGKNVVGSIVPETDSELRNLAAMIRDIGLNPEKHASNENENMRKDGGRIWVSWTNKAIYDKDGNIIEILCVGNDLTERKLLERQLLQALKMESIGTLAGGVAHDFNNLLMGILGNASLMLMNTDPADPNYNRLKSIEKQVESGSKLTSQLLGYARKGKYELKTINLNQLVKDTSELFGRTRKDISIYLELLPDLLAVDADKGQIEQILWNLYVNAADAMPGGGNFILKTFNTDHKNMKGRLYVPRPCKYVILTVTDTGIGMDNEIKERIFDPFFTTKEMGRGTGLGLASAYGIINGHDGYIDVESRKGEGTTFSIYLPASEKKIAKSVDIAEKLLRGTETVLLTDDEETILDVGQALLKAMGYKVLTAKSGQEAIELYQKNQEDIDIVILDMIMPNMSGGEVCDRMKEINPDIKVLLSSGYSVDGQATDILNRGCNGFIQKPFNINELSAAIRQILDKKLTP